MKLKPSTAFVVAPVAALAVIVAGGCAQKAKGTQDSPVDQVFTDNKPAQIINFPNHFMNVAVKCDHHGNLVYANTREGSTPIIVPAPKVCPADWPTP